MHSIITIIGYFILLPLSLGLILSILMGRMKLLKNRRLVTSIFDVYVSGILVLFFIYEILGLYTLNFTKSYTDYYLGMSRKVDLILVISVVVAIALGVIIIWKKSLIAKIVNAIKVFRIQKRDVIIVSVILGYIIISVLFIASNLQDDTINGIYSIFQDDTIAIHNAISGFMEEDIDGHTKLIEVFYLQFANMTGIEPVVFVDYIMAFVLLLFFFGVYKRIEHIFYMNNPSFVKDKKWVEWAFFAMCIALFFIDGSIGTSIPQNIWNGSTLLCSCIMPLCFIYGYVLVCDVYRRRILSALYWLLNMALLIPIAALMSNYGWQLVVLMMIITVFVALLAVCIDLFRKNIRIKQEGK